MYSEFDRPSPRQMILTVAGIVAAIAFVLVAAGIAFGKLAAPAPAPAPSQVPARAQAIVAAKKRPVVAPPPAPAPPVVQPNARAAAPAPTEPRPAVPVAKTAAVLGKVVVIDPGHQARADMRLEPIGPGSSTLKPRVAGGASGPYAPHAESEVNLEVALKLERALKARGVRVIMVRTSQNVDIANSARAAIANRNHAALFVRLHCDGIGNSTTHGLSTLVPGANQWTRPIVSESGKAGRIVHKAVLAATGAADRSVVPRSDLSGFNWSKVPTILVEMGFMSSPAEDKKLVTPSYQQKLAAGMANGIVTYLNSK